MGTKLDFPGGGHIIANDPAEVPGMVQTIRDFTQKSDQFHHQLMEMGTKAYRCNDGWVDRNNHIVTFFSHERERGWYWGNLNLTKGDKIFLGNPSDGGQFAIIDEIVENRRGCMKYRYHLINELYRHDVKDIKHPSRIRKLYDWLCFRIGKSNHS